MENIVRIRWWRGNRADADSAIPLLENRDALNGQATVYVCEHFACQMPVTEAEALAAQLNNGLEKQN
jgi:uncharacterized protein YyaL (SSP411 family)